MSWEQLRPLLWYLICIILIVGVAWWVMRHLGRQGGTGMFARCPRNLQLTVLGRTPLGRDQYLLVVQAGERYLLLGCTPGGISLVAELSPEDLAALRGPEQEPGQAGSRKFSDILQQVVKNKADKGGKDV